MSDLEDLDGPEDLHLEDELSAPGATLPSDVKAPSGSKAPGSRAAADLLW